MEAQGPTPLRRLNHAEYDHTVRDLLGITETPSDAFPADENSYGFSVAGSVSTLQAELFEAAAQTLSETVSPLQLVLPCNPIRDGDSVCAERLIVDFGKRAYRRPLTDDEVAGLTGLYDAMNAEYGNVRAMQLVMQALLQSPNFLYHVELGTGETADGKTPLTQYEIASRLSYALWASMPDDELLAAADAGALGTRDEIDAQARRMLDDPRARESVRLFHEEWLGLTALDGRIKDPTLYPGFTEAVADSMRQETERFAEDVFFDGDGRLETLLTASYSFVDGGLAPIYGVGVSGNVLVRTELDPSQRSGILTHASILSINAKPDQTSPIHRGKFVRERLMCQPPPPPPPGFAASPPPLQEGVTTRERFAAHRTDENCASCHELMDPIGLGFENYDPIGGYRTREYDQPIDATGEIIESVDGDLDGTFTGAIELGQLLAGSEQVSECVARQWFRYTFGRMETQDDDCTIARARSQMDVADGDMRELLIGLVTSEGFKNRLPVEE